MPAKLSRRGFLAATTVGAATLGVAAGALGATVANDAAAGRSGGASPSAVSEPLMVYVTDTASGEVTFLLGGKETKVYDPALVARMVTYVV